SFSGIFPVIFNFYIIFSHLMKLFGGCFFSANRYNHTVWVKTDLAPFTIQQDNEVFKTWKQRKKAALQAP
ncbi:hypothetical protein, partial [Enterocloster sp.]|uniref:hypothetical protein n=1 Tax=Enterocloster sp. TaxID=2719315 RepID=UPI003AB2A4C0